MSTEQVRELNAAVVAASENFAGWRWDHSVACVCDDEERNGEQIAIGGPPQPMTRTEWDEWETAIAASLRSDSRPMYRHDAACAARTAKKARKFGETCAASAHAAANHGADAIAAAEAGDWDDAVESLRAASACEREYGDDPAWGPVLALAERLRAAQPCTSCAGAVCARVEVSHDGAYLVRAGADVIAMFATAEEADAYAEDANTCADCGYIAKEVPR